MLYIYIHYIHTSCASRLIEGSDTDGALTVLPCDKPCTVWHDSDFWNVNTNIEHMSLHIVSKTLKSSH